MKSLFTHALAFYMGGVVLGWTVSLSFGNDPLTALTVAACWPFYFVQFLAIVGGIYEPY